MMVSASVGLIGECGADRQPAAAGAALGVLFVVATRHFLDRHEEVRVAGFDGARAPRPASRTLLT